MSVMTVHEKQQDLFAEPPRPIEEVRAALLNAKPTPVHRGDPLTAWEASVAAALKAPSARQRVLLALCDAGDFGATDYELSKELDMLRTTAGKRRVELQRIGLCKRTDRRRNTDTLTSAAVHVITSEGREVAQKIAEERAE